MFLNIVKPFVPENFSNVFCLNIQKNLLSLYVSHTIIPNEGE